MIVQAFSVVGPLFFTLLLGYIAGRAKRFDSNEVAGINELVLDQALPAALVAGAARTSRAALLQQGPLFLSLLLSVVGMYAIALVVARFLFRHDVTSAALAVRYEAYISEAGSTLAFTTIALLVTLPVGIYLVGAK